MARIVCVHGIARELDGPETVASEWRTRLRDGMRIAGAERGELPGDDAIDVAFYGDLFRRGQKSGGQTVFRAADIEPGLEQELLDAWWSATAEENEFDNLDKSARAPRSVQKMVEGLLRLRYFGKVADRMFVGALKQVRSYFTDAGVRSEARKRLLTLITDDTRLIIAHSLGSVIAYETLCTTSASPALITLGSPLGLPNVIFDRLDPRPIGGIGQWPGSVRSWTNLADKGDLVACVKYLAPLFGERIRDVLVANGSLAHDVRPYLTAAETGTAVREMLREG